MKQGTKFGVITAVMAGIAMASGAWGMWAAWTVLSVAGTIALNKKDTDMIGGLAKMSPQSLEHMRNVCLGRKPQYEVDKTSTYLRYVGK
jgi:hypothetical protein